MKGLPVRLLAISLKNKMWVLKILWLVPKQRYGDYKIYSDMWSFQAHQLPQTSTSAPETLLRINLMHCVNTFLLIKNISKLFSIGRDGVLYVLESLWVSRYRKGKYSGGIRGNQNSWETTPDSNSFSKYLYQAFKTPVVVWIYDSRNLGKQHTL